jgi:hypothetical protein
VYDAFVTDIVRGRGRGLTAETVRKTFGEGRVVNSQDALRRKMVDRVVPYPSAALTYASEFMKERRRQADLDYTRAAIAIAELGVKGPITRERLRADAQLQADLDYCDAAIRIAERM